MKRILLVGPYPPPYGGIASLIVDLAPHLARRGYPVTVLTFTLGKEERFSPSPGVDVRRVDARRALVDIRNLALLPRLRHRLRPRDGEWIAREIASTAVVGRLVDEDQVALVYTFMLTSGMFVPHLRPRWGNGVKVVATVFGEVIEREHVIQPNRAFYAQILRQSDHVVATSRYCASLASRVDYDSSRVEVIYIGVDVDRFSPNGNAPSGDLKLPTDRPSLLFVGRFHREMGLDVLLDAIPDVVARRPDAYFVLAGARGPLSDRAAAVQAAHPGHVTVRQNVPFSALPGYYAAAQVLLAPTRDRHACMGVSIKEAMAAGKAIIASRSGGIPEAVIDGESGRVLDFDARGDLDRARFAQAIVSLLDQPQTMSEWGVRARRRAVEMFANKITLDRHIAMIERLIGPP